MTFWDQHGTTLIITFGGALLTGIINSFYLTYKLGKLMEKFAGLLSTMVAIQRWKENHDVKFNRLATVVAAHVSWTDARFSNPHRDAAHIAMIENLEDLDRDLPHSP